jgi:biotin synthase
MSPEKNVTDSQKFSQAEPLTDKEEALRYLQGDLPLYTLFARAAAAREQYFGKAVRIHILDNIQNGRCAEDCGYCAQRRAAASGIEEYPLKSADEIFADAQAARAMGAYRFCMVMSGTGPSTNTTEKIAELVERITRELELKVCLSTGLVDAAKAQRLAEAGLDRYNHNLNTSAAHYREICTTHSYADRVRTIEAVSAAGIGICSGVIAGLGETPTDLIDAALALKRLRVISIPVNFFIPVPGHAIRTAQALTPEYCLRVLTVFRLIHPDSEVRIAAGREGHLRSLQSMALYVANSLFAEGYLNVKGSKMRETLQLIRDAGLVAEMSGSSEPSMADFPYARDAMPGLLKYPKRQ